MSKTSGPIPVTRARYAAHMANKDKGKGSAKLGKKKAEKSLKEKRAAKKMKKSER